MLINLLLQCSVAIITHDTNIFKTFDYTITPAFDCSQNSYSSIINFSDEFANAPQVILTLDKIACDTNVNYQLSITSVTIASFTIKLDCPTTNGITRFWVRWFAIDDPHLEVINCFNVNNPTTEDQEIIHSNPYALFGFVSITSFKITGPVNFNLSISQITETTVSTVLTNVLNLKSIGYQIILGVEEAFTNLGQFRSTSKFKSTLIPIEINNYFILPYVGFNFLNSIMLRLEKIYTTTINTTSYSISNWAGTYTENTHAQVWIPFVYTKISETFRISHLNTRQLFDTKFLILQTLQLEIEQIQQKYSQVGIYYLNINKDLLQLQMNVQIKCQKNAKINSIFYYCSTCSSQKPYEKIISCNGSINIIKYLSRFISGQQEIKKLKIELTSSSAQVSQVAYSNRAKFYLKLLSIIIENQ